MKDLWESGRCDLKGEFFIMDDCHMLPKPKGKIDVVSAGQSERGMRFVAEHADYSFILGSGINTPTAYSPANEQLLRAGAITGRDIGSYVLFMVIADETDEKAQAKWQLYNDGADKAALSWMSDQGSKDVNADAGGSARSMNLPVGAVNFNQGTLVGSYETVARMLDEAAAVTGTKGIMLTFDDFVVGMDNFGTKIQPLMNCRK